jgi:hypothetical protein
MSRMRAPLLASIAAVAVATLLPIAWGPAGTRQAAADTGPDYQMSVEGGACQPSDAGADCDISPNSVFTLTVRLIKLGIPVYRGFQVVVSSPSELPYKNRPQYQEIVWPECEIPYDNPTVAGQYMVGCTINSHTTAYLGAVAEVDFSCGASSDAIYAITLLEEAHTDETYVVGDDYLFVYPVDGPSETFTIRCYGDAPQIVYGDASCDGGVNSVDAAVILQHAAGLIASLACAPNADVNGDGRADPLDATLVLQYSAGLISHLGPPAA